MARIECIRTAPTLPERHRLGQELQVGEEFPVVVGQDYTVFGFHARAGSLWVDVETDLGYLVSVPIDLFVVVDDRIPEDWVVRQRGPGRTSFEPREFESEYFFDDLFEGKLEARAVFAGVKARLERW